MHPLLTRFTPLAALALAGLATASWTAYTTVQPKPVPALTSLPPQGPWPERISASGLIEGDGNDTVVGVPEAALVSAVAVQVGQRVAPGDLLFCLDARVAQSELTVAEAELAIARANAMATQAELARLESLPRAEDAEPAAAQVMVANAQLSLAKSKRIRLQQLGTLGADSERENALLSEAVAQAEVDHAAAALAHARLPAYAQDVAVAKKRVDIDAANIAAAMARVASAETHLSRLEIRAPCVATVISTTVMVGALAAPGDAGLVVLANLDRLLVRVEVDESQVWKLKPGLPGQGWLRGDRTRPVELRFERIEPRAAARRAIQGKPGERLDGRAVQVLYRLIDPPDYLRPGLLIDVDLESGASGS